ncbi:MAG: c-type cytochrome biogenesis protein CcmI [Enterobacteriaceae bacterium]|jgi:cytochrome c-type biogenesis protein CcmI|nr:c-type cytochrome biogenesis protein CcmI [Enterobacteriaceae bacterium]
MMIFWFGVALAVCLLILIIWLPIFRQNKFKPFDFDIRRQTNIALYQQQIALADKQFSLQEKQQGLLAEFQQELSLNLLQNIDEDRPPYFAAGGKTLLILPLLMTLLVLGIPALGFSWLGQYSASAEYSRQGNSDPFIGLDIDQIQDKVLRELHQRIQQVPNDSAAWFMLGHRYLNSNEFERALVAFDRAAQLRGNDAELLAAKATALYYQANQHITPQTQALITQALKLDPNQATVLMLLASDYFLNNQYQQAIAIWQQLLDSNNPQIDRAQLIEAINMARMMR